MSRLLLMTALFSRVARQGIALLFIVLVSLPFIPATAQNVSTNQLLKQMIAIAADNGGVGHTEELNALKQQIEALPKPQRGNRTVARKANDQGLQAFKMEQHEQARQFWQTAYQADPSDVEIADNLGLVSLKLGDLPQALKMLSITLGLSPGRSSTWANLAEYFALQGKPEQAVACYALVFHFSSNQDRTRNFLQQRASSADTPQVRQAAQQALQLALIQGGGVEVPGDRAENGGSNEDSLDAPLPMAAPAVPPVSATAPAVADTAPVSAPAVAAPTVPSVLAAAPAVVTPAPMSAPPVAASATPPASVPSAVSVEAPPQAPREPVQQAQNAVSSPGSASSTNGVQTVVMDGLGTDVPSAAQNAAQNALTNVVGSFMDSTKQLEKRVEIQEGIRSQTSRIDTNIKEYSQGSIQGFEILGTSEQAGLIKVTAKVTVRIDDFKAYIKKLAEGKAAVDGGLFASLSTEGKQKENLEKIVIDLIIPVAKGEVSRFDVGKPVSLDEAKKAIDQLYLKTMSKFGNSNYQYKQIDNLRKQMPGYVDNFLKSYHQKMIVYVPVTVTIDPSFYENLRKTLENTASRKKKYKYKFGSCENEFNGYYECKQDLDVLIGIVGVQESPLIGDVYTLKGAGVSLTKKFPWFAVGTNFGDAIERGDYSFKKIAPHLEIEIVDNNQQMIQSFDVSFRAVYDHKDGIMLVDDLVSGGSGHSSISGLPWSLLINSHVCSIKEFPLIIPKREFGILLALDESTLKKANDIKVSLVPPPESR